MTRRAIAAAKDSPRMPRERERRLQLLLDKGSSGTLARGERSELRLLLDEARKWTLLALERAAVAAHKLDGAGNGRAGERPRGRTVRSAPRKAAQTA
jgi:hypothetical protein